jgi:hypothetical protein
LVLKLRSASIWDINHFRSYQTAFAFRSDPAIPTADIYEAPLLQLRDAIKPLLVFAAVTYGIAGAVPALVITGMPFGLMALLGVASLIGVILRTLSCSSSKSKRFTFRK